MNQQKVKQLKNIGRAIAKYPLDRFKSNCLNEREVRISIYLWARDFESGRNDKDFELDQILKEAKDELMKLMKGKNVIALLCP